MGKVSIVNQPHIPSSFRVPSDLTLPTAGGPSERRERGVCKRHKRQRVHSSQHVHPSQMWSRKGKSSQLSEDLG